MTETTAAERKKKYYALRELLQGNSAVFQHRFEKEGKRAKLFTYFLGHVDYLKCPDKKEYKTLLLHFSGPSYVDRTWLDTGPSLRIVKLKENKPVIKLFTDCIDMNNIILECDPEEELREYVGSRIEEIIDGHGGDEEEGEEENLDLF